MGAFYSAWVTNTEALHMAPYCSVREGKILWINGKSHSQSEIVQSSVLGYNIDCITISQSQTPTLHAQALVAMHWMREDEAFDIID